MFPTEAGRGRWGPRLLRLLLCPAIIAILAPSASQEQLSVYGPRGAYTVSVIEHDRIAYVDLLLLLGPLGTVNAGVDGHNWTVRFNNVELQLREGKTKGKIGGNKVELSDKLVVESGRALVSVASLPDLVGRVQALPVTLHETSRRLFVGNAHTSFIAELKEVPPTPTNLATPVAAAAPSSALVLRFSAPVSPAIHTEPGKLEMIFQRDPLLADPHILKFDDKLISSAVYSESDGAAELTIYGSAPLMARFSDGGTTITIGAAPGEVAQAVPPTTIEPLAGQLPAVVAPPASSAAAPAPVGGGSGQPRFLVLLDDAHGGEDKGAVLADNLSEKDVTLALAARLRDDLLTHGVTALMVRDSDAAVSLEQRAALSNSLRVNAFISLHAGSVGNGVRIYTSMLAPISRKPGSLLPWETAQAVYVDASKMLAETVAAEFSQRQMRAVIVNSPLRPLDNVAAPAIAVELEAPQAADSWKSTTYLDSVSAALTAALQATQSRLTESK